MKILILLIYLIQVNLYSEEESKEGWISPNVLYTVSLYFRDIEIQKNDPEWFSKNLNYTKKKHLPAFTKIYRLLKEKNNIGLYYYLDSDTFDCFRKRLKGQYATEEEFMQKIYKISTGNELGRCRYWFLMELPKLVEKISSKDFYFEVMQHEIIHISHMKKNGNNAIYYYIHIRERKSGKYLGQLAMVDKAGILKFRHILCIGECQPDPD